MSRKYCYQDVATAELPRIVKLRRDFGDRVYEWRCTGRASTGWGTTPRDAYNAWARNWRRRVAFYGAREETTQMLLKRHRLGQL